MKQSWTKPQDIFNKSKLKCNLFTFSNTKRGRRKSINLLYNQYNQYNQYNEDDQLACYIQSPHVTSLYLLKGDRKGISEDATLRLKLKLAITKIWSWSRAINQSKAKVRPRQSKEYVLFESKAETNKLALEKTNLGKKTCLPSFKHP